MTPALWRASLRHLVGQPWQAALAVLGIALGVAVALAIDLATESARRSFALATEAVTGRATHQISGGPSGVPEDVYRLLRVELGVRAAAPVVAADVALADHSGAGRTFHLFGVDPLAEAALRPDLGLGQAPDAPAGAAVRRPVAWAALVALLSRPGAVLVPAGAAAELGLRDGDALALRVGGGRREAVVVGRLEPVDRLGARALESLLVADIATAQELLGARGRLTRIDLVVADDDAGRALLARVRAALPPGLELSPAGARADAVAALTSAFALNLRALSLLALVVGTFLVYNTMAFSVVRRRTEIGTLRAIGVTRGQIFAATVVEALALGAIGTAVGAALGVALARVLLGLVTRTINDLYFALAVREVSVTPAALVTVGLLGVGASVVAALAPALEAAGARPREALNRSRLEARARRAVPRLAVIGGALLAAGSGALLLPRGGVLAGFGALFAALMGAALLTPAVSVLALRVLAWLVGPRMGPLGRLAARGVEGALSRTAVAIAALMVAVAATIGVGIMISSFRGAVVHWLESTLSADVYVSTPSLVGSRPDATLDPVVIARLTGAPGVAAWSTSRGALVPSPRGPVQVIALALSPRHDPGFRFRGGRPGEVWRAVEAGAVVVSEPFAYRHAVGAGDRVRLRTDAGERDFAVAGVFNDYGSSAGVVVMHRRTYDAHWADRAVTALALFAPPGASVAQVDALVRDLRARAAAGPELVPEVLVRSNRALREASLEIFDRTFAITGVLRLLVVAVAFLGVLGALTALELERVREAGILRALGVTPGQIWRLVTGQTAIMGALAGLLAVPTGIGLAAVLVYVINRRSFGWTIPLHVAPWVLVQGLALAVGAAVLAGLYPARRMARTQVVEALRDE